jgi:heme A synthase
MRVTGKVTLATDAAAMSPSTTLAIIHGVFAHLVLAVLVAITAVTSRRWRAPVSPLAHPGASTDRTFNWLLVGLIVVQTFLGALVRHNDWGVMIHITLAGIVAVLALTCAMRAVAIFYRVGPMRRAGISLMVTVGLQLTLGVIALAFRKPITQTQVDFGAALITTLHQTNGAIMLAVATSLATWTMRELKFDPNAVDWNAPVEPNPA